MPEKPVTYLVLDIETIPDRELFTPPEPRPGIERDRAFPPLYACRPVVIGVMWMDENLSLKRFGTIGEGKDEAGMLTDFADFMGSAPAPPGHLERARLRPAGAALRSLRHGLSLALVLPRPGLPLPLQRGGPPRPVRLPVRPRGRPHDLARRRRPPDRAAGQGRRRRQPGRGPVQRRPDRGPAALLPVRRHPDRVPVPALPPAGGPDRSPRLPAGRRGGAGRGRRRPLA